jgi:predicted enzyme related to lactoylglutathione lyase
MEGCMTDTSPRGRFLWYDLLTTDPDAAVPFYKAVAGWETEVWPGATPYTMWKTSPATESMIGGVVPLPAELQAQHVPPHWLAYIGTPNVDETIKRVHALGGRTLSPAMEMPDVGRFATLADPQGASFAVFSPTRPPSEERPPKLGEFSWHELTTTDYAAAFTFYSDIFGWEKINEYDMGPMGIYFIYGRNGQQLGGMFNKTPEMPMPPNWLHYIRVADADAAADRTKQNGGTVINGPMDVPGGDRITQCLDPQGGMFAVHAIKQS